MAYNPKSLKAEEFISDEEILATLEYAEQNKHNAELIEEILEKARPKKTADGVEKQNLNEINDILGLVQEESSLMNESFLKRQAIKDRLEDVDSILATSENIFERWGAKTISVQMLAEAKISEARQKYKLEEKRLNTSLQFAIMDWIIGYYGQYIRY